MGTIEAFWTPSVSQGGEMLKQAAPALVDQACLAQLISCQRYIEYFPKKVNNKLLLIDLLFSVIIFHEGNPQLFPTESASVMNMIHNILFHMNLSSW